MMEYVNDEMALHERGEHLLAKIASAKDTILNIANTILIEYESLGCQYARTIQDEHDREKSFIMLGKTVQTYKDMLDRASIDEYRAWSEYRTRSEMEKKSDSVD